MFNKKTKRRLLMIVGVILISFIFAIINSQAKLNQEQDNLNLTEEERMMKMLGVESEREKLTREQAAKIEAKKKERNALSRKEVLHNTTVVSLVAIPIVFLGSFIYSTTKDRKREKEIKEDILYTKNDDLKEELKVKHEQEFKTKETKTIEKEEKIEKISVEEITKNEEKSKEEKIDRLGNKINLDYLTDENNEV